MHLERISLRRRIVALTFTFSVLGQQLQAAPPTMPSGGKFAAGSGAITASGNTLTVNQSSGNAIINWNSFSVGKGGLIRFDNGSGVTLNRVTGTEMSSILGNLISSGSVYLINPQGILIGPGAHINTGGDFVASTLDITNHDFLNYSYHFSGDTYAVVTNLGNIFSKNGSIFLIAHDVNNSGQLRAANGSAGLAAGSEVLLRDSTTDGRIFIKASGGNVTNSGQISAAQAELRSKGGNVFALAGNDGGQISATGTAKINGQAWLIADGGKTVVAGKVLADNANGAGGSIETSGRELDITGARVSTGRGGSWLLDPVDITIDAAAATAISNSLATTSVEVMTTADSASGPGTQAPGNGDINVNSSISWPNLATTLVLSAYRNVNINNATFTSAAASTLELRADNAATGSGTVNIAGNASLGNFAGVVSIYYHPTSYTSPTDYSSHAPVGGTLQTYMNIDNVTELQHVQDNLSGSYGLNAEIDLSSVSNFTPIGTSSTPFSGIFEGEGHNITNLSMNSYNDSVGLFGVNSGTLRHFGVDSGTIFAGGSNAGGVAGVNAGTIDQVSYRGFVSGAIINGGLVGLNTGTISNSYAQGTLNGGRGGGLVGTNGVTGTIATSYSTVLANQGLTYANSGSITDSYWDTDNSGTTISQGGIGLNRVALQSGLQANFSSHIWDYAIGFYPVLKENSYESNGAAYISGEFFADQTQLTGNSGVKLQGIANGTALGHTAITGADGYYNFYLPNTAAPLNSGVAIYIPSGNYYTGISYFNNFQHSADMPITNNYVTLQSAQGDLTSIVASFKSALGSLLTDPASLVSINASNQLNLSGSGASLDLIANGSSLALNQPINTGGLVLETRAPQLAVTQTALLSVNQLSLLGGDSTFDLQNISNSIGTVASNPTRNAPQVVQNLLPISPLIHNASQPQTNSRIIPYTQQTGSVNLFDVGDLHIGNTDAASGIYEATTARIKAQGNLSIDSGITAGVEADGSGDALVLATGAHFANQSGFGAGSLLAPSGRWLVWSQDPAYDQRGGINYGFKQYNATYGLTTPAESDTNGVLYTLAPVLTPAIPEISKQYNSTTLALINPTSYIVASGAADNDVITVTGPSTGVYDTKNVGINKTVTVTGLSASASDGQTTHIYGYQMNPTLVATGVGTVTRAPLTLGTIANSKTYDGTTAATGQTTSFNGLFSGDHVSVTGTATYTFANKNAGLGKTVTAAGLVLSGADAGNYTFTLQTALANIAKATLTQLFTAAGKVYDGTTNVVASLGSAPVHLAGDSVSISGTASFQFADKNAGTAKTVNASGLTLTGADAGNYVLAYQESGTADITPAQLLYVANSGYRRDYGTMNPSLSGTVTGLVGGDTLSSIATGTAVFTSPAADAGPAGIYPVLGSGLSLSTGNYTLAQAPGNFTALTVTPITVAIGSVSRLSTQPNPTFTVSAAGVTSAYLQSLLSGLTLVTDAPADSAPGVYQITAVLPAALAGSLIVQPGTLTITAGLSTPQSVPPYSLPNFPASLQTLMPVPPASLPALAGNNLIPANASAAFQIAVQPSPDWASLTQNVSGTGANLSSASFADVSPDGRTTDHKSTYAAGAHQ